MEPKFIGQPKEYFYSELGLPVNEKIDSNGIEWVEWQGVSYYWLSSTRPIQGNWKFIVKFKDGIYLECIKPAGFFPPPMLMRSK